MLAYVIGFAVVLAFILLRFIRPPKRPDQSGATGQGPGASTAAPRTSPWFVATRTVGVVLLVATFVIGAVGVDDSAANIATVTVIVLFFLGMQVVSVAFGDVFWWFNPFDTLAALFFRHDDIDHGGADDDTDDTHDTEDDGEAPDHELAPSWTAAAFLASFIWFVFAYPEFYPPTPHEVAIFLAVYTAAVLAGAGYWGRSWVRHGEGFGALFGALAQLGRRRAPGASRGLAPLLTVYLGGILFDGMSQTTWWIDILGTSRGWTERAINTVGFAWCIAIIAVAYLASTRVVAAVTHNAPGDTARLLAPVMLAVGFAWSVAHYISAFLIDVQNFYALLSDPLGRGWDLFGTIDSSINYQLLTTNQTGIVQSIVLTVGCIAGAVIAHDLAFANYRGRTAVRATYPLAVLLIASAAGAIWLLVGV
jgi:hypothetical protein